MTKQEVYALLDQKGIPYEATEHEAVFHMAQLSSAPLPYPEADAKNLFVCDDKRQVFCLITVRGEKRVDLKAFRRAQGLRPLSFASPEELERYLELRPGSVTPLGALCDGDGLVRLYLDRDFWKEPRKIGIHPCDNTATVWLDPDDLVRLLAESGHEPCLVDL